MSAVIEDRDTHRHRTRHELAELLKAFAAVIVALSILIWVLWQVGASVKATGFDADGVRCFAKADQMSCIKTAEPPR